MLNQVSDNTENASADSLASAVIDFARILKENGLGAGTPALMDALRGIRLIGIENIGDFRIVLKSAFAASVDEFAVFNRLFGEYWLKKQDGQPVRNDEETTDDSDQSPHISSYIPVISTGLSGDDQSCVQMKGKPFVIYSPLESLKRRNFSEMENFRDNRIAGLIRELIRPLMKRMSAKRSYSNSGQAVDLRRLLRKNILHQGEIYDLPRRKVKPRVKRLIFLCDVSGSMTPYMKFMLRFIYEMQQIPTKVETFVFATRLNRITQFLRFMPFQSALKQIGKSVEDWSGGTRIGACLNQFTSYHGGSLLRPSTVVIIHSDGWDRGDQLLLEKEMNKIHRNCYRTLWINPLLGGFSYEPTCRGMKTALPFIDSFLPGHNVLSLEKLAGTLRGII